MKRWQADEFGNPQDVLKLVDVPMPEPGPDEALVRVLAASVALPDLMMVRGTYPLVPSPPVSPGQEVVGVVVQAGVDFPHPAGSRIVGNSRFDCGVGGLAEYTLVPAASALPVIPELSNQQAVGFPGSFQVAHIGLHHRAHMQQGETLLVLGGAGRTGSAAVQLGKAMGAIVIATARSSAKAEFCIAQGADHVVDLSRQTLSETVNTLTSGRGVDVIYDSVGGEAYAEASATIAPSGGRVLLVGFASGTMAKPDAGSMLYRDYSVSGVLSSFRTGAERDETLDALATLLRERRIDPPVTATHPFDSVPDAIESRENGAAGQSVVEIASDFDR